MTVALTPSLALCCVGPSLPHISNAVAHACSPESPNSTDDGLTPYSQSIGPNTPDDLARALERSSTVPRVETMWNLPADEPVPLTTLAAWERGNLCILPEGSVTRGPEVIIRNARPVVELHAATATGPQLRPLIRRLAPFLRATQCIGILQARERRLDDQLWEADAAGIGVWLGVDNPVELVKPDVYRPEALTSGRWAFGEMIYDAWLNTTHPTEPPIGRGDRRVRRDFAAPCQPSQDRLLD